MKRRYFCVLLLALIFLLLSGNVYADDASQSLSTVAPSVQETEADPDTAALDIITEEDDDCVDIETGNIEVQGVKDALYTGGEIKFDLTVILNETVLQKDTDYTVSYSNNINPGTASLQIRGTGAYTGELEYTFKISNWDENGRYHGADGSILTSRWVNSDSSSYLLDGNGYARKNTWVRRASSWSYLGTDGRMVRSHWVNTSNKWYWLNADGNMAADCWVMDGTGWCWVQSDGSCLSSQWIKRKGAWYYLNPSGYMARNQWVKDKAWYWMQEDGKLAANRWINDGKGWCWVQSDGSCLSSRWIKRSGAWYYLNPSGYMARNQWVRDKAWYWMLEDGKLAANRWINDGKGWCWVQSEGKCLTNQWLKRKGVWYFLKPNGYMAVNECIFDGRKYYFMDSNGRIDSPLWKKDDHGWYYVNGKGERIKNQWVRDDKCAGWCWLDSDGYWVPGKRYYQNPAWMVQISTNPSKHGQSFYMSPCRVNAGSSRSEHIEAMINRAYDYIGDPFIVCRSGKPGQGLDCSGLVMQAGYAAGIDFYPSTPYRHTFPAYEYESREIWKLNTLETVAWKDRQRGDLIFYANGNGTVIHIAIYLGDNKVIHSYPGYVRVSSVYGWGNIKGVKRVFH